MKSYPTKDYLEEGRYGKAIPASSDTPMDVHTHTEKTAETDKPKWGECLTPHSVYLNNVGYKYVWIKDDSHLCPHDILLALSMGLGVTGFIFIGEPGLSRAPSDLGCDSPDFISDMKRVHIWTYEDDAWGYYTAYVMDNTDLYEIIGIINEQITAFYIEVVGAKSSLGNFHYPQRRQYER